ncbi:MAG: undecaprenyl-phosphate galactose phosphotransferase WbaP [Pirellulales bacterium]|nr:undecaprenyl-phosphate galactose phosphotransferase WbaP [Pirellulales bacterium]
MLSSNPTDSTQDFAESNLTADSTALASVAAVAAPRAQSPSIDVLAVAPTKIRSKTRVPRRNNEAIRTGVLLPEPRKDGLGPYLRQWFITSFSLVLADLASLLGVVVFCSLIGLTWLNAADESSRALVWLPSISLAWILINTLMGLYPGVCLGLVDEIRRLSLSVAVVSLINLARLRPYADWFYDRLIFLAVATALCMFVAPIVRSVVRKSLARTSWWGFPTLVCGNDSAALNVDQWLLNNRRLGLRPVGVIADPKVMELDAESSRYIGSWSEARAIAEQRHAYWAVLVEPEDAGNLRYGVTSTIEQFLGNIPNVFVISKLTGIPDHWNRHQLDEGLAGVVVEQHLQLPIPQLVKRGMDLSISAVASLFLLPLFAVLGVAIKLTSPGPVFYGHERVGRGNSRFKAWKFRTMIANAESALHEHLTRHPELREEWERDHKLKNDPRVTRLGKWMRKWSIDELPQILNVFWGDMSIVGPRPIVEAEIAKYGEHFETFSSVLPGITGLWQVCGRNDTTYDERVQLDMYYVHHWSPWMDLYLLVRTVKTVLFTRGAY